MNAGLLLMRGVTTWGHAGAGLPVLPFIPVSEGDLGIDRTNACGNLPAAPRGTGRLSHCPSLVVFPYSPHQPYSGDLGLI